MSVTVVTVYPLPDQRIRKESELSDWQEGETKPSTEGTYLREFEEGEGTSVFSEGQWLRDGFFPSDVQDFRWRGLRAQA